MLWKSNILNYTCRYNIILKDSLFAGKLPWSLDKYMKHLSSKSKKHIFSYALLMLSSIFLQMLGFTNLLESKHGGEETFLR